MKKIRNFSIIAHIDHGKSTLSDCLISYCRGLEEREMKAQVLDSMDIERERGITIKAQSVAIHYDAKDGQSYLFNFIDTPGHVDFSYEVSRSLKACEGALLVVDASQGVEAQTVANCYTAVVEGLEIIPVINKIDLPSAQPDHVKQQIEEIIGIPSANAVLVSAKERTGIRDLLETIVKYVPAPKSSNSGSLRALIIDSWFDKYLGVVSLVRIFDGFIQKNQRLKVFSTQKTWKVDQLGVFTPKRLEQETLGEGEVGFLVCGIKSIRGAPVGDSIVNEDFSGEAIVGFQSIAPKVFSSMFPISSEQFEPFRNALEKYTLNDAAFSYEPETSDALGHGFRCGFLGTLHMEIVQERLEREYHIDLLNTSPSVEYQVVNKKGEQLVIQSPSQIPNPSMIEEFLEPIVLVTVFTLEEYLGGIIGLCIERRGVQKSIEYLANQVVLKFEIPMSQIVLDFYDRLKSISRGYASMDYEFLAHRASDLVRVDVFINGVIVDALSAIMHRSESVVQGRQLIEKIKEHIPKQMFDVAIQAGIGQKIIGRANVSAMRKNVTAKCYGGDITRKKKLLEKQKAGKKRMRQVGNVSIPQEAFMSVLSSSSQSNRKK